MDVAAHIIGMIALMAAVPSSAQMIWGAPALRVAFGMSDWDGGRILVCQIFNTPVRNRFLRTIGVTRQPTDLDVFFQIYRALGDVPVTEKIEAKLVIGHGKPGERRNLSGPLPAVFNVAAFARGYCSVDSQEAPDSANEAILEPGTYRAEIAVTFGDSRQLEQREFTVGKTAHETWL